MRRLALLAPLLLTLAGCAERTAIWAGVRDRGSREMLPGATVRVENVGLNPLKPEGSEGVTGQDGWVRLEAAAYNSLLVRFSAPGRGEVMMGLDHPAVYGDSGWVTRPEREGGGRSSMEVRLLPGPPSADWEPDPSYDEGLRLEEAQEDDEMDAGDSGSVGG